jgi:hypothetical protein
VNDARSRMSVKAKRLERHSDLPPARTPSKLASKVDFRLLARTVFRESPAGLVCPARQAEYQSSPSFPVHQDSAEDHSQRTWTSESDNAESGDLILARKIDSEPFHAKLQAFSFWQLT